MLSACLLGIHLVTAHVQPTLGDGRRLNERNPGLYVNCPNGLTVGTLVNSYHRQSFYAGHTWEHGSLSLTLGGMTGYAAAPVMPFASAGLRIPVTDRAAWRISFLPRAPKVGTSAAIHLSLELTGWIP